MNPGHIAQAIQSPVGRSHAVPVSSDTVLPNIRVHRAIARSLGPPNTAHAARRKTGRLTMHSPSDSAPVPAARGWRAALLWVDWTVPLPCRIRQGSANAPACTHCLAEEPQGRGTARQGHRPVRGALVPGSHICPALLWSAAILGESASCFPGRVDTPSGDRWAGHLCRVTPPVEPHTRR